MELHIDQQRRAKEIDALGAISQEPPPVVITEADVLGREFVKQLFRDPSRRRRWNSSAARSASSAFLRSVMSSEGAMVILGSIPVTGNERRKLNLD